MSAIVSSSYICNVNSFAKIINSPDYTKNTVSFVLFLLEGLVLLERDVLVEFRTKHMEYWLIEK
jgi:hypothetical protein